jgi:hypothetical protein
MQTVLLISKMALGEEVAVRRLHESFPLEALERGIGVERLLAFIGNGWYALEITVGDGDFQSNFHRFLAAPEFRDFFAALRPFVPLLPTPDAHTADLPLATAMLLWQAPGRIDATAV